MSSIYKSENIQYMNTIQFCNIRINLLVSKLRPDEAEEYAKAFIDKMTQLSAGNSEYFHSLLTILERNHREDKAYLYLLHILRQHPNSLRLIQKICDLSLYLGYLDDAYYWASRLVSYTSSENYLKFRKARLDLFLRKKASACDLLSITGQVFSRSTHPSFKPGDPPGEKEILALNPEREENLERIANSEYLYGGTLNLRTDSLPNKIFQSIAPVAFEAGIQVIYPSKFAHIPKQRIGYWYYKGFICSKDRCRPVLFKYPDIPYNVFTLEVFSAHHLRDELSLSDNELVICYFAKS